MTHEQIQDQVPGNPLQRKPPPYLLSHTFFPINQSPDSPDVLLFWSPLNENGLFICIIWRFSHLHPRGGETVTVLPRLFLPPPLLRPLFRLLYVAELPPPLADNLNSQNPIQKPRSHLSLQLFPLYTPHLVPCPCCLLGSPVLPTSTLETHNVSSMFDLTNPINTCDAYLPSLWITHGGAPISASFVAPPILPE